MTGGWHHKGDQRGDTLVEVVMAMAIFTLVLLSAYTIASLSVRIGIQARERTQAVYLAQQQAERLLARRDELLENNQESPPPDGTGVNIFSISNFRGSNAPYVFNSSLTKQDCGGTLAAPTGAGCQNGIFRVAIGSTTQTLYRPGPTPDQLNANIRVSWESAVGESTTNTINVTVTLSDTRANPVRDCSVKGEPQCI